MGFSREVALKIYKNNRHIIFEAGVVYLSNRIFEDINEDIVEEANEVYLNNYNRFK